MQKVNDGETPNKVQFLENVDNFVKDSSLERFFKGNPNYIQELAKKAIPTTLALHRGTVVYRVS